ncbi:MAG: hypothetical protein K2X82_22110 [Gemmataceae bacterium]|nr:hypothetical protein [Gemmataceae bacterium]
MPRLPARTFYAVILLGTLLGVVLAAGGAWRAVRSGAARPEARGVWADVADDLVVPLAGMMGGTFGGLAGVAAAVLLDRLSRRPAGRPVRGSTPAAHPTTPGTSPPAGS